MNSNRTTRTASFTTTSATRFLTTRAQLSPLGRRAGVPTAGTRQASLMPAAPRTLTMRTGSTATFAVSEPDAFAAPSFWNSGALDRIQPEVTRYHE